MSALWTDLRMTNNTNRTRIPGSDAFRDARRRLRRSCLRVGSIPGPKCDSGLDEFDEKNEFDEKRVSV